MPSSDEQPTRFPWESTESDQQRGFNDDEFGSPPVRRANNFRRSNNFQKVQQSQSLASDPFAQEMLDAHNRYREMHQVPPLALDVHLTRGAQNWANVLARQEKVVSDPSVDSGHLGENLAMKYDSTRTNFTGAEMTDYWYTGINDYNFADSNARLPSDTDALSFTQIVWRSTERAGFARAVSNSGRVYVVGRYYPPGNAIGEFARNVPPKGAPSGGRWTNLGKEPSQPGLGSGPGANQTETSSLERQVQQHQLQYQYQQQQPQHQSQYQPQHQYQHQSPYQPQHQYQHQSQHQSPYQLQHHSQPPAQMPIGAIRPTDQLLSSSTSTTHENGRTIVSVEEKYAAPDGSTYTRHRKTTHYGK